MPIAANIVQKAYVAFFNRPADVMGLDFWTKSSGTFDSLLNTFAGSAEYTNQYTGMNSVQIVNQIYQNLFARDAEPAGLISWAGKLDRKELTLGNIASSIADGAQNTDATSVANKVSAATSYTASLTTSAKILAYASSSTASMSAVKNWLKGVTTDATLTSSITTTALDALATTTTATAVPTGSTFTLTNCIDSPASTSGDDIFYGTLLGTAVAAGSTVGVADTISMGAGTDTLVITTTAATAFSATILPTLSGVDVLRLNSLNGATSLVGTVAPDMTTLDLKSYSAASAMTVTAASANLRTINMSDSSFDVNDLTVTYAAAGSSTATDSLTFNLSSVDANTDFDVADDTLIIIQGAAAGTDNGIEQFVFNVTGTNKLETLSSIENNGGLSALNRITVNGTGSLSISTALATDAVGALTVNASANTGGVSMSVGTTLTTFTGGSGNDTVIFATAGDLDANDVINLGAGNNKIRVAETALSSSTTALNAAINGVTTAQTVEFSAAVTGLDMSVLTATKVGSIGNVNLTATKQSATDTFIISGGGVAARTVTVNGAIGFTTVNLEYVSAETVASTSLATSVSANTTINIVSTSDSTSLTNTTGTFTPAANATITVTGNGNITFGTTAGTGIALGAAASLNASALTGILTVTGAAGASILTGGSGADTITGGTGNDTITGGAGSDTIVTGAADNGANTVSGGLGRDLVSSQGGAVTETMAYNATAAESFSSATATGTTSADTLTLTDGTAGDTATITFTTGVLTTSTTITATATSPTMGTTTVTNAFDFLAQTADNDTWFLYQDTDGDRIIEQGEWMVQIVGAASDASAVTISSGKLVITNTYA